jgi:cytochrome c1
VGGEQNAMSCAACHWWRDERSGLLDPLGHVAPNSSVWDSARRPIFWRGFAETVEQATTLCVRRFMLRPGGPEAAQLADLAAYLRRISPDTSAPLDHRPLLLGRKTAIDRPTGGDGRRGALLTERHCGRCHAQGAMRPPLEVGLYEPDYLVARVRWIAPHDAKQMPPMPMDRLTDSELRDIVTHLVGPPDARIFQRKPTVAPRTERTAPGTGPLATVGAPN